MQLAKRVACGGLLMVMASVILVLAPIASAADAAADGLEKAKTQRTEERNRARAALATVIDAQIKTAGAAGDLDTLKALTAQKDALSTAWVTPNLPSLKDAVAQYTQALRKADGALVAAYETAIETYTAQSKAAEAMNLRRERQRLLDGKADQPSPDSPEAIGMLLDRAKADYQQAMAEAKRVQMQSIDARVTQATDAGDLATVTRLQAARTAADADQPLPEGFKDVTVQTARTKYQSALQSANQKLAAAYREAVKNYTRVRAIDKAQATQTEFESTGLAGAATPGTGAGTTGAATGGTGGDQSAKLTRALPSFLTANGAFATEKDGIRPAKNVMIGTRAADFLSKDFVFDVQVRVPKEDEWVVVGLGDLTEKGSIRLVMRQDGGWGRRAFLTHGDMWGKHIGDIHVGEVYTVRIERHGGPVTASVGVMNEGKFTAEFSQTVPDPKAFVPALNERRAALYFGGGSTYLQARLAIGAAAASVTGADAAGGGAAAPFAPVAFPAAGGAATGAPVAAPVADSKGVYRLNSDRVPALFEATGTYSASPAGIKPFDGKCLIQTKAEDFLSKDFIFEATVDLPKKDDRKDDWVVIGLGDGSYKGSVRLVIRADGGWGTRAFLCPGDEWGKNFGDVKEGGQRVLRIERHGTAVTTSVGFEKDGQFEAEMSQTVPDAKATVDGLNDRRARLFITGRAVWSKVKLLTGADAAGAPPVPTKPAAPVKPKRGK